MYEFDMAGFGTIKFPVKDDAIASVLGNGANEFDVLAFAEQDIGGIIRDVKVTAMWLKL